MTNSAQPIAAAIKPRTWFFFILAAMVGVVSWFQFSYSRFAFVDLSVTKQEALSIAENFLREQGADVDSYRTAIIFITDDGADRYLQRTLGIDGEIRFLKKHDFDLFIWLVRFFKENEKEEYRVSISAASGQITSYNHIIPETAARPDSEREEAKLIAINLLKERFGHDLANFHKKGEFTSIYDNRKDHFFAWQKKNVFIPWSDDPGDGGGKLLTGATVSGGDVLSFSKYNLEIPDKFNRSLDREKQVGRILSSIFRILSTLLLIGAVFIVVTRRHHLSMHVVKPFIIILAGILFAFNLFHALNEFQTVIFNLKTATSFQSQYINYFMNLFIDCFYISIVILLPGLAGEALHYEEFPHKLRGSFLHYIRSSFLNRDVAGCIILGYFVAIILLGAQSVIFHWGHTHLGVWTSYNWVTRLSTSYFPFLAALIIAFQASLIEEVTFRVFCISLGKKLLRRIVPAVIIASLIWGYGHSNYLVFPMWFRGLEVSLLGCFLAWVYLRFGLMTVLVAHFIFDAFWITIGIFLGQAEPFDFYTCLVVMLLPLAVAVVAFIANRTQREREMAWRLNPHQKFNLTILRQFIHSDPRLSALPDAQVRQELLSHYWDAAVVDAVLEERNKSNSVYHQK